MRTVLVRKCKRTVNGIGQEEYLCFENIVVSYKFDIIILLFVGHGMESVCLVRLKLV